MNIPAGVTVPEFTIPDREREQQRKAIDPRASVWVSANAGSGKTTILTKRVIRLLMDGVDPSKILCLTYTKAAAAEMQNRVFDELGKWVTLDAPALDAAIADLEGARPDRARIARARRLFARAVETPGGLKIQTIHAFCERLLHLFPFEANVPARFEMMDDAEQEAILSRCIVHIQKRALAEKDAPFANAFARVAEEAGLEGFGQIVREALSHRAALTRFATEPDQQSLRLALGLKPGETEATIDAETLSGGIPMDEWSGIADIFRIGEKTDRTFARDLREALAMTTQAEQAAAYRRLFLKADGEPKTKIGTRAVPALLRDRLVAEASRIKALTDRRKAALAAARTEALFVIATEVASFYAEEKRRGSVLDFDDLISGTADLLDRTDSRWILYKLDAGIEHLLIDEAQDTSPDQWRILAALTEEFFAGSGQSDAVRTIFAVGDEKQSIYSFQGAAPQEFDQKRSLFRQRVETSDGVFHPVELQLSFRTTADVLSVVDTVFQGERFAGLGSAAEGRTVHETARRGKPGLVEIWPLEEPEDEEEIDPNAEVDALPVTATEVTLAARIAARIAFWMKTDAARFDDDGARIRPGDVMILVRRRNAFFECMIRALKNAGVPVAGADRLNLTSHIAVMDLIACAEAALMPEDDLTLATALKSPLIGLGDEDLIAIAAQRGEISLFEALALSAQIDDRYRMAFERLRGWQALARQANPFQFFSTLLSSEGGRRRMLARLGPDAAEAMDVFLGDAIAWQNENIASLFGFLNFMHRTSRTVKRELESGTNAVRVMTVHAAKGLEARIVFMADTLSAPHPGHDPKLLELGPPQAGNDASQFVWSSSSRKDSPVIAAARERSRQLTQDEYRRLLYVGLTRARDRLYIAGYRKKREPRDDVWFKLIESAVKDNAHLSSLPAEDGAGEVMQWRTVARTARPIRQDSTAVPAEEVLRAWLFELAPPEDPSPPPPLRPSHAHEAADRELPSHGRGSGLSRRQGILIHYLLERLPDASPERRAALADRLLELKASDCQPGLRTRIRNTALRILSEPAFAPFFAPGSRAEIEISGHVHLKTGESRAVTARIDRLAVSEREVLIADFKTGLPPADPSIFPEVALRQLAVYRALVSEIYPGRTIRAGLIWTASPAIVFAGDDELDAALERAFMDVTIA